MPDPFFDSYIHTDPSARCERCGEPDSSGMVRRCPQCGFWLCVGCRLIHDGERIARQSRGDQSFCTAVLAAAQLHLGMRLSEEEDRQFDAELTSVEHVAVLLPSADDWVFAHRMFASTLWKGPRC